jgi:hypothetical protein
MKKTLSRMLAINTLTFVIFFIVLLFSVFLLGYADPRFIPNQRRLLINFLIVHLIINFFILWWMQQLTIKGVISSILLILLLYFLTAKYNDLI